MSRGRHALPQPPRSYAPLLAVASVLAAAAVASVWVVDDSLVVAVGVTGLVVLLVGHLYFSLLSSHRQAVAMWQEAMARRRDLGELQHELADVRSQQVELLLELRELRLEVASAAEQTARSLRAATDQRDLMHELLTPRPRVADPVYPSLHLPLVRAAFSAEFPAPPQASPSNPAHDDYAAADETTGGEPFPPRQLLDLTASEIARLRPAN